MTHRPYVPLELASAAAGSAPRTTKMLYPSSFSCARNALKYSSEMGCGAGNMLLKFHHPPGLGALPFFPPNPPPACTLGLSTSSRRRTANQCWSRLHRNATSSWGDLHALPASREVAGTHVRFQTSSAFVRTWMLKFPSAAAFPLSSAMYLRKSALSTPDSRMSARSRSSNSVAIAARSCALKYGP